MLPVIQRFALVARAYFTHELARTPRMPALAPAPEPEPVKRNGMASSKKAVGTRKARYGSESKMKRDTREDRSKKGWKLKEKAR